MQIVEQLRPRALDRLRRIEAPAWLGPLGHEPWIVLAALLWIAIPFLAIPLFVQRYHEKYVDLTLPQALGFSGLADFPSTVCLLLAAYLVLRALDGRAWRDAVLAGLVAGFALGLKPSN